MPERYGKLPSEWPFVSDTWGLADLPYKLFWMPFQRLSFVSKPEGRHPVRLAAPTISSNEPADLTPSPRGAGSHRISMLGGGEWRWKNLQGRIWLELETIKADPQIWLRPSHFLDIEAITAVRRHHLCCAPE
jgi:hypothetical protein